MAASNTKFRVENGLDVIGSANVSGNLRILGDLTVNGTVTQAGTAAGDFLPGVDDFYFLGNTSNRWILNASNGNFSSTLTANNITVTGTATANALVPYTNSISLGSSTRLWNLNANTADIVTATITSLTVTGNSSVVNLYSSGSIAPQSTSSFNASTGVANTTEYITTASAHAFVNGDVVTYLVATGNTAVSGLSNNTTYYVVGANSTALQLASSLGGAALNLTSGTSQTGHTLTSQIVHTHNRITATGATANIGVLNVLGGIANSIVNGNVVFDTDLLFLDATNNRIGFKNTSPSSADLITITGNTALSAIGNAIRFLTSNASHNAAVYVTGTTTNTRLVLSTYDNSTNSTSQDGGFLFNSVNATSTVALLSATKGSFQYKSGNVAHSGNFGVYDINGTRVGP